MDISPFLLRESSNLPAYLDTIVSEERKEEGGNMADGVPQTLLFSIR